MAYKKYVALRGSEREPMHGATKAGSLDPNAVMHVTLGLRSKAGSKQPSLDKLLSIGESLPRDEYEARYGANPADVQEVEAFASAHGLAVAQVNLAARTVILTGRCADFARTFQVQLARYEYEGGAYRGRTGPVNIPTELSRIVTSVHGLDNRPQAEAHFRIAAQNSASAVTPAASFTSLQIAKAYNFPSGLTGKGETIGIIELGGGFTQSDLQTYFSGLNISPAPTVVAVSVDGGRTSPPVTSTVPTPKSCLTLRSQVRLRPERESSCTSPPIPMPVSWMPSIRRRWTR